jgi:uncharacterized protein
MTGVLADTGALVALLDRSDPWHTVCAATFGELRPPLLTFQAVLTDMFHLLTRTNSVDRGWEFVLSGSITLAHIGAEDLPALNVLARRYADRPMDFADATLVHLAEREGLDTVFTVDHDDFETYRISGRRRFRIVPERRTHSRRRQR